MTRRQPLLSIVAAAGVPAAALLLLGCESSGLSPRETRERNIASYMMSTYEAPAFGEALAASSGEVPVDAGPARLTLPARVGVAQVGEVAPPDGLLDTLRGRRDLFASVEGVPGVVELGAVHPAPGEDTESARRRRIREEMQKMQGIARGMGMDYLLLAGGTIDEATRSTGWSAADLTIVGAFLIPSKAIRAEAKATGALIDLKTSRVVLTATASEAAEMHATSAAQEEGQLNTVRKARDKVLAELGKQILRQVEARGGPGGAPTPPPGGAS